MQTIVKALSVFSVQNFSITTASKDSYYYNPTYSNWSLTAKIHFLCSWWHKAAGSATVQSCEPGKTSTEHSKSSSLSAKLFFSEKTLWLTRQQHHVFINPPPAQQSLIITDMPWMLFSWRIDTKSLQQTLQQCSPIQDVISRAFFDWTTAGWQETDISSGVELDMNVLQVLTFQRVEWQTDTDFTFA